MLLKLQSDFLDFYDHAFDLDGYSYRRVTTDGPDRAEMIAQFKHAGIPTPKFGRYADFVRWQFSSDGRVVVYTDLKAHCGEGKKLKRFGTICCAERETFLMEYIPFGDLTCSEYFSKSTRYLLIGDRCFVYNYFSKDDWRSNCGDVDISEPKETEVPSWRYCLYYPMFAVDFVEDKGVLKAVDLNIAPGAKGIGLEKLIKPAQIVEQIKKWFSDTANCFEYFNKSGS